MNSKSSVFHIFGCFYHFTFLRLEISRWFPFNDLTLFILLTIRKYTFKRLEWFLPKNYYKQDFPFFDFSIFDILSSSKALKNKYSAKYRRIRFVRFLQADSIRFQTNFAFASLQRDDNPSIHSIYCFFVVLFTFALNSVVSWNFYASMPDPSHNYSQWRLFAATVAIYHSDDDDWSTF